jgi:hypothetical protein
MRSSATKQFAAVTVALIVSAALAQSQNAGAPAVNANDQQGQSTVQTVPANDAGPAAPSNVQRPLRQRLRDPNRCQAPENRPGRQGLCDPADCPRPNCPRRDGANCRLRQGAPNCDRGPGMKWGRGHGADCLRAPGAGWERGPKAGWGRGQGPDWRRDQGPAWGHAPGRNARGWDRPCMPNCQGRGFRGGRHHGWNRWNEPPAVPPEQAPPVEAQAAPQQQAE